MNNLANLKKICANQLSNADKWRFTLYTTFLLLILFNTWTFIFTNKWFSIFGIISNKEGCPTWIGFVIHVIVFTIMLRYLMDLDI